MKCKQTEKLPVVNEWQKVMEPCCKHHEHGHCTNPERKNENDSCIFDNIPLPVREVVEKDGN